MENRKLEIENLKSYTLQIENEVTLILQTLQWDTKHLLEGPTMSICKYDMNHRIPPDKKNIHEEACSLKSEGYTVEDVLLPDPLDPNSNSLVKLSKDEINVIINDAANKDPTFMRGSQNSLPLSLERLQCTYTADERRAIHDAVVNAVPFCHDLTDLALLSNSNQEGGEKDAKKKSRTEILAELRDMKRRRTKYRVAAKTKNYSDALRDVIRTQMELYTETQTQHTSTISNGSVKNDNSLKSKESRNNERDFNNPMRNTSNNNETKTRPDNNASYYDRFRKSFMDKKTEEDAKEKNDINKGHEKRHGHERRYGHERKYKDERMYSKAEKYRDKRDSPKDSEAETSNHKYYEKKRTSSYRDEHKNGTDKKRYKNSRSGLSERDSRHHDRYRDEKGQKYVEKYRNRMHRHDKLKRHDEIKKEKFKDDDYSQEMESSTRIKQENDRGYY